MSQVISVTDGVMSFLGGRNDCYMKQNLGISDCLPTVMSVLFTQNKGKWELSDTVSHILPAQTRIEVRTHGKHVICVESAIISRF